MGDCAADDPPADDRATYEAAGRRLTIILVLGATTQLLMAFTSTATNIAFPKIETSFSTPRTTLVWGITGFAIAQAALLLLFGRVADRAGHRRMYFRGVAIFVVGSIATAASLNGELFIASRIVQAIGAAMILPSSLALVLNEFPQHRRIWLASMSAGVMSVGQATSPIIGALLVQWATWRAVYVWPALMCLSAAFMARRFFRETPLEPTRGRLDILGAVISSAGVAALAYAITVGPRGWLKHSVITGLALSAAMLTLFVRRSTRHPVPLLQLQLLRYRSVWSASLVCLLTNAVGVGLWVAWPLLLTQGLGYSSLETGVLLTPAPLIMAVAALASGWLVDRVGPRAIVLIGVVGWIAGITYLLVRMSPSVGYGDLLPAFSIAGIGWGCTMGPLTGLALVDVNPTQFGQIAALLNTIRFVGGALGTAIAVGLIGNSVPPPLRGFDRMHVALLVVAAVSGLLAAVALPRHANRIDEPNPPLLDAGETRGLLGSAAS
ncbi:MAG: MFS transporter [Acidimicrobiales bacterium]|nr:MFS transporter [Acidimicrobiales bacterium]